MRDYACVTWRGIPFVLFHYPIAEWDRKRYGAIHLHGHLHSRPEYNLEQRRLGLRRYDVGVDAQRHGPGEAAGRSRRFSEYSRQKSKTNGNIIGEYYGE